MTNSHHADPIRYWDSCAFLAYFNEEEEKDECEQVLAACSEGKAQIVTSALTLAEVLKAKGKKPLPMERSEQITSFFEHSYIVVRTVTRRTAEFARQIIWEYSIDPKDAIHVATALHANIDLLETKDRKLLSTWRSRGGQCRSSPALSHLLRLRPRNLDPGQTATRDGARTPANRPKSVSSRLLANIRSSSPDRS
jgi:predicted nucleic acid-binding protein